MRVMLLKDDLQKLDSAAGALCSVISANDIRCAASSGRFLLGEKAQSLFNERIQNVWCSDDKTDARYTPVCIGVAGASEQGLALAHRVNQIKDSLAGQFIDLRNDISGHLGSKAGQDKAFRRYLSDNGLSRLSVRLVNRHIPVLDSTPSSIRFAFKTRGRSVTRITVAKAHDLLSKMGFSGPHIDLQRDRLSSMPPDLVLARVQELPGFYKANITYPNGLRVTIDTYLPIIYPLGDTEVRLQSELKGPVRNSARRKDSIIEDTPLIPSLRLHAYRNGG